MTFQEMMAQRLPEDKILRAADGLNSVFLWANRALDTTKEAVWIDFGLPFTSQFIHDIAHINLERLDAFGDVLHENHIRQTYPPTSALTETIEDVDKAFEITVSIIDEVDAALNRFIETAGGGKFNAMALAAENIQMENSADRTKVLQAWKMWSTGVRGTSFDNWILHLTNGASMEVENDD